MENFKHTMKDAWFAVRAKATKSDSIEAYAFLRKQHKLAKLKQIKSRYPLLLEAKKKDDNRKKYNEKKVEEAKRQFEMVSSDEIMDECPNDPALVDDDYVYKN